MQQCPAEARHYVLGDLCGDDRHKVRVTGHMVRLGAEIRVNVTSLQMVGASCGN